MNATLLYRIAAVLFFLFGVGHLYGSLTFLPSSAEGRAVFQAMQDVHFTEKGARLYDPDGIRAELMEFQPSAKPCCSPFLAASPTK